jgi:hypothetical protein
LFLSPHGKLCFEEEGRSRDEEKASMYTFKSDVLPSFLIILLGSLDALTTVIGVLNSGAVELNPFMTGIVSTNITAFLAIKISATFLIGFTYILAKRTLNKTMDKSNKTFKHSNWLFKGAYAGLTIFLIATVVNNLIILLA